MCENGMPLRRALARNVRARYGFLLVAGQFALAYRVLRAGESSVGGCASRGGARIGFANSIGGWN